MSGTRRLGARAAVGAPASPGVGLVGHRPQAVMLYSQQLLVPRARAVMLYSQQLLVARARAVMLYSQQLLVPRASPAVGQCAATNSSCEKSPTIGP